MNQFISELNNILDISCCDSRKLIHLFSIIDTRGYGFDLSVIANKHEIYIQGSFYSNLVQIGDFF